MMGYDMAPMHSCFLSQLENDASNLGLSHLHLGMDYPGKDMSAWCTHLQTKFSYCHNDQSLKENPLCI